MSSITCIPLCYFMNTWGEGAEVLLYDDDEDDDVVGWTWVSCSWFPFSPLSRRVYSPSFVPSKLNETNALSTY